jgi:tetratricopeptide (TPR) repeat protein
MLDESLTHARAAVAADPAVTLYQSDLAELLLHFGELHLKAGRHDDSLRDCREAAEISRRLVEIAPSVPDYQFWLALAHGGEANAYLTQGKHRESLDAWRKAFEVQQVLCRDHPSDLNRANLAEMEKAVADLKKKLTDETSSTP